VLDLDLAKRLANGALSVELQVVGEAMEPSTAEVALHLREAGLDGVVVRVVRDVEEGRDLALSYMSFTALVL